VTKPDAESVFKLRPPPHRTKGRGLRISISERLRVARRIPQAVVKVTSFCHGLRHVSRSLDYITRKGTLPLEKDNGEVLLGRDAQDELAADWSMDFDFHKRSRDTANLVFSMPPGSDVDALRGAVRKVGQRAFQDHEWVFAIHEDRSHPHAHMMVQMRGRENGKKLRLRKADLFHLRELFAEAAREEGVQLAASPRSARGVGRKGIRQDLYFMKQRGIDLRVEREAAQEAIQAAKNKTSEAKPWEDAMAVRHEAEQELNARYAERLRSEAEYKPPEEKKKLMRAAEDLERLAKTLPKPKSRRQAWIEQVSKKLESQQEKLIQKADEGREIEK